MNAIASIQVSRTSFSYQKVSKSRHFQIQNQKKLFPGRGTAPFTDPSPSGEGDHLSTCHFLGAPP